MRIKSKMIMIGIMVAGIFSSLTPVMAEENATKNKGYDSSNYIYTEDKPETIPWGIQVPKYVDDGKQELAIEMVALVGDLKYMGASVTFYVEGLSNEKTLEISTSHPKGSIVTQENKKKNTKYVYMISVNW